MDDLATKRVVLPLCGANIDITTLGRVIERGLAADGRLVRFVATVSDRPGGIAKLTDHIASSGGSIKDIYHERAWLQSSVSSVQVKCIVECTSRSHAMAVQQHLVDVGYPLIWGGQAYGQEFSDAAQERLILKETKGLRD